MQNTAILKARKQFKIQLALWDCIKMWIVWGFTQWASEPEKLLDWQGNLHVPTSDNQTGFC